MSLTTFVCSILIFLFGAFIGSIVTEKWDTLHTDKLMTSVCATTGYVAGTFYWRDYRYTCPEPSTSKEKK